MSDPKQLPNLNPKQVCLNKKVKDHSGTLPLSQLS